LSRRARRANGARSDRRVLGCVAALDGDVREGIPFDLVLAHQQIIRLTSDGRRVHAIGGRLIDELEKEWADRYGAEHLAALRQALEAVTAERLGILPVS
jgi:hypothetical protein